MPRGPRGGKRPADVIGNAVKVMRIATGEEEENPLAPGGTVRPFAIGASRANLRVPTSYAHLLYAFAAKHRSRARKAGPDQPAFLRRDHGTRHDHQSRPAPRAACWSGARGLTGCPRRRLRTAPTQPRSARSRFLDKTNANPKPFVQSPRRYNRRRRTRAPSVRLDPLGSFARRAERSRHPSLGHGSHDSHIGAAVGPYRRSKERHESPYVLCCLTLTIRAWLSRRRAFRSSHSARAGGTACDPRF